MKKWMIVLIVIVGALLIFIGSCAGKYNQLVTLDESVDNTWAQVENVLQRRYDLIPNLVNTVKGYAAHENAVFTQVTEARAKVGGAVTVSDKIAANNQLTGALSRLLLVAENYPELKANQNFLALQDELAGTENRISVERMRYNEAVRVYNTYVRTFPNNLIATVFGYSKKDAYFESTDGAEKAPEVKFN